MALDDVVFGFGTLVWLVMLDARLALVSASLLPILAVSSVYFSGKLRVADRRVTAMR